MCRSSLLIVLLSCFVCRTLPAQTNEQEPNTLLWRISGNGLRSPSYLFGTIHITDKRVFSLGDSVYHALGQTEGVATELNMEEAAAYFMESTLSHTIRQELLSDQVDSRVFERYREQLAKKLKKPSNKITLKDILDYKHAWMKRSAVNGEMNTFLDAYLYGITRKQGKWTGGIEDIGDQAGLLRKVTDSDLEEVLASGPPDASNLSILDKLIAAYLAENIREVHRLSLNPLSDTLENAIFTRRNYKMSERMDSLSHTRSTFFATGAAHLAGEKGLIALLRQKGFSVDPVFSTSKKSISAYSFPEVKTEWLRFTDSIAGYSFSTPGKTARVNVLGAFDIHFYFDLYTQSCYYGLSLTNPPSKQPPPKEQVFARMAKEMFSAGRLRDSANIVLNGIPGKEYRGSMDKGQMTLRIFQRRNTIYALAGYAPSATGQDSADLHRFFASASIDEPVQNTQGHTSFQLRTASGAVITSPVTLLYSKEMSHSEDPAWSVETHAGMHLGTGTYLMAICKYLNPGYQVTNDSSIYFSFNQYINSTFINQHVEEKKTDHHRWLVASGNVSDEPGVSMRAASIATNNAQLVLIAIGDSAELRTNAIEAFLTGAQLREISDAVLENHPLTGPGITLLAPAPFKSLEDPYSIQYYAFDSIAKATYVISLDTLGKYAWFDDENTLWESILDTYKDEYVLAGTPALTQGESPSMEFTAHVSGSFNTYIRLKYILKNNVLAKLAVTGEKEWCTRESDNRMFRSFQWETPGNDPSVFTLKSDQLFTDLKSPDSSIRSQAYSAIRALPRSASVRAFLRKAILHTYDSPFVNEPSSDVNDALACKLAEMADPGILHFVKEELAGHEAPSVKGSALILLTSLRTDTAYQTMISLLSNNRPFKEVPALWFSLLSDSIGLAHRYFPQLMQVSEDSAFCLPMAQLARFLVSEGKITKTDIQPLEKNFVDFAALVARTPPTAETDYRLWSLISLLDTLGTPASLKAMEQFLSVPDVYIRQGIVLSLLKKKRKISPEIIRQIASNKEVRLSFYEKLEDLGSTHLFPASFLTRRHMAEGTIYYHGGDEEYPIASIRLVGEKPGTYAQKKYHFLLYEVTYGTGDEKESYLGVSGGYTFNSTDVFPMKEVSGIYWNEPFQAARLDAQLKNYLDERYRNE